jgi:hypothetical protein
MPLRCPIQWIAGSLSPGVKRQGREADHSPSSCAEVKSGGAIPPLPHMSSCHSMELITHRDKFALPYTAEIG